MPRMPMFLPPEENCACNCALDGPATSTPTAIFRYATCRRARPLPHQRHLVRRIVDLAVVIRVGGVPLVGDRLGDHPAGEVHGATNGKAHLGREDVRVEL